MATKRPLRLVTVIEPDGTVTMTQESNPNLERLQKAVGGYIPEIPDFKKYNNVRVNIAYCNENGLTEHLPYNIKASQAWVKYLKSTGVPFYPLMTMLYGLVIIVHSLPKAGA